LTPLRSKSVRFGLTLAVVGGVGLALGGAGGEEPGTLARLAPWAVRIGLSIAAGYVVGWMFRRARAKALALAAVGIVVAVTLKQFGVLDDPALEQQLKELASSAAEGASRAKDWMYGLLPDGAAAGTGAFFGVRSDPGDD